MESSKKLPSVTSGEKGFIEFLVDYLVETSPGDLQTNLQTLSQYMLDKLPPKCETNLYRKQYGNLKDCVLQGKGIMCVFQLDGTSFRFRKNREVLACIDGGILTSTAQERYF